MSERVEAVLQEAADNLSSIQEDINDAKELLSVMQKAGEDTTQLRQQLAELERKKDRWQKVLSERGMTGAARGSSASGSL